MVWNSSKQRARVLAGSLIYESGLYRMTLPATKASRLPFRSRLYSYLRHYLNHCSEAEATLFIEELGMKVCCDLLDHMLAPYLAGTGTLHESTEIQHCKQYCKGARYILDIGANHGFWGLSLSKAIGSTARLLLFEANPVLASRLQKTFLINKQILGKLYSVAVAEHVGETTFYLPRAHLSGLGSTVLHEWAVQHNYLDERRKITVPTITLDALLQRKELVGIDLMKIDVEHAEDHVVAGGMKSISRFRPKLIMCETFVGSSAWSRLRNLGYESYRLNESGDKDRLSSKSRYWGNVFFTPCDQKIPSGN